MEKIFNITVQELIEFAIPFAVLIITVFFGYILRKIMFRYLYRWAKHTKNNVDDVIVKAVRTPVIIWFLMLGIYLGLSVAHLPPSFVHIAGKILLILGVGSVTIVAANISGVFVRFYLPKFDSALAVTSLTNNITVIIVFVVGFLIILNSLGISISPLLATLGVGGLAVALALQDTLANFFAGVHIILAHNVRVGDYIKLDTGESGYVFDINWRTTNIKMLPNNVVLVPNSRLTKAIVTNYYLPDKEMAVLVNLGVHYNSDLKKVEKITCAVGKEIMKEVKGGVPDFEPFIRYNQFDDSSINFTVILRAKEYVDQYLVKHEFVKRLQERYMKEGIVIPFPIRAINYEQEKA